MSLAIIGKNLSKAPTLAKEVAQFFRSNPRVDMHVITEGANKGFYMRNGNQVERVVSNLTERGNNVVTQTRFGLDDLRLSSANVQNHGTGARLSFHTQKPDGNGIVGKMKVESGEGDTFMRSYNQDGTVLDTANVAGQVKSSYVEDSPLDSILIMLDKMFLHF